MKEVTNIRLLKYFGINGIVLWPFIFYADRKPNPQVRNHESIHADQIRRDGVLKFYTLYLTEYARGRWAGLSHDKAYRDISFEREAYENQHNLSYLNREGDRTSPRSSRSREPS